MRRIFRALNTEVGSEIVWAIAFTMPIVIILKGIFNV